MIITIFLIIFRKWLSILLHLHCFYFLPKTCRIILLQEDITFRRNRSVNLCWKYLVVSWMENRHVIFPVGREEKEVPISAIKCWNPTIYLLPAIQTMRFMSMSPRLFFNSITFKYFPVHSFCWFWLLLSYIISAFFGKHIVACMKQWKKRNRPINWNPHSWLIWVMRYVPPWMPL